MQKDVQEDLLKNREERVKSAIGIRHVIDLLSSERKLIVGHSCFLGSSLMCVQILPIINISHIRLSQLSSQTFFLNFDQHLNNIFFIYIASQNFKIYDFLPWKFLLRCSVNLDR